jgi:hypothetical protein
MTRHHRLRPTYPRDTATAPGVVPAALDIFRASSLSVRDLRFQNRCVNTLPPNGDSMRVRHLRSESWGLPLLVFMDTMTGVKRESSTAREPGRIDPFASAGKGEAKGKVSGEERRWPRRNAKTMPPGASSGRSGTGAGPQSDPVPSSFSARPLLLRGAGIGPIPLVRTMSSNTLDIVVNSERLLPANSNGRCRTPAPRR